MDVRASYALNNQTITEIERKQDNAIESASLKSGDYANPSSYFFLVYV